MTEKKPQPVYDVGEFGAAVVLFVGVLAVFVQFDAIGFGGVKEAMPRRGAKASPTKEG